MSEAAAPQPPAEPTRRRSSAGGAAASGGDAYQRNVAAWLATLLLAEEDASLPWDLPARSHLITLWCQAPTDVDDVVAGTSSHGFVFVQAKCSLSLGTTNDSDLANALGQMVRQFLRCRAGTGAQAWERPLASAADRLVLAVGPGSSGPVRIHLAAVLNKVRRLPSGSALSTATANAEETEALTCVRTHVERLWREQTAEAPSGEDLRQFLALVHVSVLDLDPGGAGERECKDRLRVAVLADGAQSDAAWNALGIECSRLASERSLTGSVALRDALVRAGITPRAPRSYRPDIERLQTVSQDATRILQGFSSIQLGSATIKLSRPVSAALRAAAENASLLVTGDPGAGKSGALSGFVHALLESRRDVLVLAADHYATGSLGMLRLELGLEHDLVDVLRNWPGSDPAFLVVDALDAARAEAAANTFRQLIAAVQALGGRWRVVASIRKYDLRMGVGFRNLFAGSPVPGFADDAFGTTAHAHVPLLSDAELEEVSRQSPDLGRAIQGAPADLHELLRVPFNLRLLAEIIGSLGHDVDLRDIHTDLQLLERYWEVRVIREDHRGDAREIILRRASEAMVENRRLTVERHRVVDAASAQDLPALLSARVLDEWQPPGQAAPERETLLFSHHALFDFSIARLLIRGRATEMAQRIEQEPDLLFMVQPGLRHHLRYVWDQNPSREPFWDLCFEISGRDHVPEVVKLLGPSVASDEIRTVADVEPLIAGLASGDQGKRSAAEHCLAHLARAILARVNPREVLLDTNSPWPDIAARLSETMTRGTAYDLRPLLLAMSERTAQ